MRLRAWAYAWCSRVLGRFNPDWRARLGQAWLPYLTPADLSHLTIASYRAGSGFDEAGFNRGGLHPWEAALVQALFPPGASVLVAAAGAGREMIALGRKGFVVTGFDPAPALVAAGQRNLAEEDLGAALHLAPPSGLPPLAGQYDAVLVGAGAYHHIPTCRARIAFIAACMDRLRPGGPMILGSVAQDCSGRAFEAPSPGDWPEPGDSLNESFGHAFVEDELLSELTAAGLGDVRLHVAPGRPAFLASGRKPSS